MPCIESIARSRPRAALARCALTLVALAGLGLAGCTEPASTSPSAASPAAPPATTSTAPSVVAAAGPRDSARATATAKPIVLPPPRAMRDWAGVRQQAAERIVAANPSITYLGKVPDQLLAIPVLEVELNGDGSIRRIEILRPPRQAKDTLQIAIDSIRRAAPFGDVSRLAKPWKFVETFLFDEARKFKPRTLDK